MKEIRTCIVCRGKFKKSELNRIYQDSKHEVVLDPLQKAQFRANYVCFSKKCHSNLIKNKALNRAFKQNISEETYIRLAKSLKFE